MLDIINFIDEYKKIIIIIIVIIIITIIIIYYLHINNILNIFGGNISSDSVIYDINTLNNKVKLILYYSDNCIHCNNMKPIWQNTKKELNGTIINNYIIDMLEINGDENPNEIEKHNLNVYPSILLTINDKNILYDKDEYTKSELEKFININI